MPTIRELREREGWTQAELAERLEVNPMSIYYWETGRREPRVPALRKIAETFRVRMEDVELLDAPVEDLSPGRPRKRQR